MMMPHEKGTFIGKLLVFQKPKAPIRNSESSAINEQLAIACQSAYNGHNFQRAVCLMHPELKVT